MEYRRLGKSGLQVSIIGLGGNTFGATADESDSIAVIQTALELGVNYVDTADSYSSGVSEEYVGKAVEGRRHDVVIGTKVGVPMGEGPNQRGLARARIMASAETSLKRLGTDYIDLYQAHMPDRETPLEETLRAFDDLVRQGKVRYLGCSNYAAWQVVEGLWLQDLHGWSPWISVQPSWNIVDGLQDPNLLPMCRQFGVGIIPYMPLAAGVLTGKYTRGEDPPPGTRLEARPRTRRMLNERMFGAVDRLRPWAEARDRNTAELAIAWLASHQEVSTVIVGARRADQVQANLRAADWSLTPEECDEVAALARA